MSDDFVPASFRVVGDAAAWARSHPAYFFNEHEPRREQIEQRLEQGARAGGALDVALIRCGAWSVVGSRRDWFNNRLVPLTDDDAFERPRAFPELGVNGVQGEFVVGAFARAAFTADSRGIRTVRGDVSQDDAVLDILRQHPEWMRAVAFFLTES
jgi:hypothetical protein